MEYYFEKPTPWLEEYDVSFFVDEARGREVIIGAHVHSEVEILYITHGTFTVEADGVQAVARPGDMVIFRANTIHSTYLLDGEDGCYYVLKLTPRFLLQTFRGGDRLCCALPLLQKRAEDRVVYSGDCLGNGIIALWHRFIEGRTHREAMQYAMEKAYAIELTVLLYRTFFADSCAPSAVSVSERMLALICRSIDYINENYASALDAADCARMVNLSYSYYAKMFRAVTGKSFTAYLVNLRLARAHGILLTTDLPVTDVALSCGYKNPAHFTAEYKRQFGVTPRQTRKSAISAEHP